MRKTFIKWVENKHLQVQFWLTVVTLFLTIATFLMAGFMFWQARILKNSVIAQRDSVITQKKSVDAQKESIDVQIKELRLSKRPYVYVEIENVSINPRIEMDSSGRPSIHYMVQAEVKFKNEGIIPAVITNIIYFVTTNVDKRHLDTPKYFIENLGSYPYPTIIFPKQENLKFKYSADCSSAAERVYFNVIISYEGYKDASTKNYWYSFTSKYASISTKTEQNVKLPTGLEEQISINLFTMVKLEMKGNWDRDAEFKVPAIYEPDWGIEEKQIGKQRQFLK